MTNSNQHCPSIPDQSDEDTPLLQPRTDASQDVAPSQLPKTQLFLLCYVRLLEPIVFFSIFAFISQMVSEVGRMDEADVGFYTGFIESFFSITQMFFMIAWGRASDRFGRKPVLVSSLAGEALFATLFGFSSKIWQMIFLRGVAGLFAGTLVTLRTMIAEISTSENRAQAFGWFTFAGNLGILVGPAVGGALAKPVQLYPNTFGHLRFFHDYPYALVTICTGSYALSALFLSALFIEETLPPQPSQKMPSSKAQPAPSIKEILKSDRVSSVLVVQGLIMMLALAYSAVAPVFWYTSPSLGGYGFSPQLISAFLIATGILQAIWTLFLFPALQHRMGSMGVLKTASTIFPMFYGLTPITVFILRKHQLPLFWATTSILQLIYSLAGMSAAIQLAISEVSPSPAALGTLNSIALAIVSGIRAVAPSIFASLFATSVKSQMLKGYLVWIVLAALSLLLVARVWSLPTLDHDAPENREDA